MPVLASVTVDQVSTWLRGSGLEIVLIAVGSQLLVRAVSWFADRLATGVDPEAAPGSQPDALAAAEAAKHRLAVVQVLRWVTVVLIDFVALVLIVQRFDIPLTTFIAPATVVGVAVGFGAQKVVADFLSGFFLVAERQYGYGDIVRISQPGTSAGVTGTVEEVTLRVTRLRTMNGEVLILPNGEIRQVTNLSRDWARAVIDVPVPAASEVSEVTDRLRTVCEQAFADESLRPLLLDPPSVMGVESLDVEKLSVRIVARTLPGRQFDVGRILRSRIAPVLRDAEIDHASPTLATAGVAAR